MTLPDRITAHWISSLSNDQLQEAERTLHDQFSVAESAEKARLGAAFSLMRGPELLTQAWFRWSMVCNATRDRGLRTSYRR